MSIERYAVITETNAPEFVKLGGKIEFEASYDDNGNRGWFIYGRRPDGKRVICIVPRTSEHKRLSSSKAVLAFYEKCHPEDDVVTLPIKVREEQAVA